MPLQKWLPDFYFDMFPFVEIHSTYFKKEVLIIHGFLIEYTGY